MLYYYLFLGMYVLIFFISVEFYFCYLLRLISPHVYTISLITITITYIPLSLSTYQYQVSNDCKGIGWEKWQALPKFSYASAQANEGRLPGPSKPTLSGKVAKNVLLGWEPSHSLPAGWMQAFKSAHVKLVQNEVDEDYLPGARTNVNK